MTGPGIGAQAQCPHGLDPRGCRDCAPAPVAASRSTASSFSDRYRGTEWGIPVEAVEQVTVSSTRRRAPVLITAVGLVLAMAVAGMAVMTLKKTQPGIAPALGDPGRPVAVAPGAVATPSHPASDASRKPGASATPKASAAPARPHPATSPVAAPSQRSKAAVIAAYERVTADRDLTAHIAFDGTIQTASDSLRMSGEMDVAGDDFAADFEFAFRGEIASMRVVVLGDRAFARFRDDPWQRMTLPDRERSANPFRDADGRSLLKYVRAEKRGGRTVHHLTMPAMRHLNPALLDAERFKGVRLDSAAFDLVVTDDGTPLSARFTMNGRMTQGAKTAKFGVDLDYRFSRIGEDIVIKAPRVGSRSVPAPASG